MKIPKRISAIFMAVIMLLSMGLNGLVVSAEQLAPDVPWPTSAIGKGTGVLGVGFGNLTIHKYKGLPVTSGFEDPADVDAIVGSGHDGSLIDPGKFSGLAAYPGVKFLVYSATDAKEGDNPLLYTPIDTDPIQVQTDGNGVASITNLPLGIYFVKEVDDGTHTVGKPFFVQIPMTSADGTKHIYDVHVYPKNEEMIIEKEATIDFENLLANAVGGSNIRSWEIKSSIPTSIAQAVTYVVSDEFNDLLIYDPASLKITVKDKLDLTTPISVKDYFKPVYVPANPGAGTKAKLTITLKTEAELLAEGDGRSLDDLTKYALNGTAYVDGLFHITFDTQIDVDNITAADLTIIDNKAGLEFKNTQGFDFKSETPDIDTVPIGIHIEKTIAGGNTPLAGAVFYIFNDENVAKAAVAWDADDWTKFNKLFTTPSILPADRPTGATVDASGYPTGVLLDTSSKAWTITSDANGDVDFLGLTEGKYYIVEAKAPNGYNKLLDPIEVIVINDGTDLIATVDGGTNTDDITTTRVVSKTVENNDGFELPLTGGAGTMLFTLFGLLLIGAAIVIYTISKKRKEQQA